VQLEEKGGVGGETEVLVKTPPRGVVVNQKLNENAKKEIKGHKRSPVAEDKGRKK